MTKCNQIENSLPLGNSYQDNLSNKEEPDEKKAIMEFFKSNQTGPLRNRLNASDENHINRETRSFSSLRSLAHKC